MWRPRSTGRVVGCTPEARSAACRVEAAANRQGDGGNRTPVNGFAGRCVTTPPRRRVGRFKRSEHVGAHALTTRLAGEGNETIGGAMKYVITGGAGYIGSRLVEFLAG